MKKKTNQHAVEKLVEEMFDAVAEVYEQLGQGASVYHRMGLSRGVYNCSPIEVLFMLRTPTVNCHLWGGTIKT